MFSLFLKKNCEDWKIFKGKLGTELFTWNGITAGVSQYQLEVLSSSKYMVPLQTLLFNLFQPSGAIHIKTSYLICDSNQMNGFYMKGNAGLKWVKGF